MNPADRLSSTEALKHHLWMTGTPPGLGFAYTDDEQRMYFPWLFVDDHVELEGYVWDGNGPEPLNLGKQFEGGGTPDNFEEPPKNDAKRDDPEVGLALEDGRAAELFHSGDDRVAAINKDGEREEAGDEEGDQRAGGAAGLAPDDEPEVDDEEPQPQSPNEYAGFVARFFEAGPDLPKCCGGNHFQTGEIRCMCCEALLELESFISGRLWYASNCTDKNRALEGLRLAFEARDEVFAAEVVKVLCSFNNHKKNAKYKRRKGLRVTMRV